MLAKRNQIKYDLSKLLSQNMLFSVILSLFMLTSKNKNSSGDSVSFSLLLCNVFLNEF